MSHDLVTIILQHPLQGFHWNGRTTSLSPSNQTNQFASCTMLVDPAPLATTPIRVTTPALSVLIQNMECLLAPITDLHQILYKVVTPYILEAWRWALLDAGILQDSPTLIHDLKFSSPIGNPP